MGDRLALSCDLGCRRALEHLSSRSYCSTQTWLPWGSKEVGFSMNRRHRTRRIAALAACAGITATMAVFGGAPAALAAENTDTCTTIYGSGSSFQKIAQGAQEGFANKTTLSASYLAGVTKVTVSNGAVYAAKNKIVLGVKTANEETVEVTSVTGNELTLKAATTKEHTSGDVVAIALSGVFLNHWAGT